MVKRFKLKFLSRASGVCQFKWPTVWATAFLHGCRFLLFAFSCLLRTAAAAVLANRNGPKVRVGVVSVILLLTACSTIPESRKDLSFPVEIPFMRMEPSECYYLDDFLPTPDSLVTGKNAGMYLRYYTFNSAIYKFWREEKVMLAFYSRDQRCWSLFEEYATSGFGL